MTGSSERHGDGGLVTLRRVVGGNAKHPEPFGGNFCGYNTERKSTELALKRFRGKVSNTWRKSQEKTSWYIATCESAACIPRSVSDIKVA